MANQKSAIHDIPLKTQDLCLNVFDGDIKPYEGFRKNNSPFYGNTLSPFYYKKSVAVGEKTYVHTDGVIYTIKDDGNLYSIADNEIKLLDLSEGHFLEKKTIYSSGNESYPTILGFFDEGSLHKPYKRKFSTVWNYIKGKANSVYFRTTGKEVDPTKFSSWMNTNGSYVDKTNEEWRGSVYTFYAGKSQSGLMFRVLGGKEGPNQVQMNYSVSSNRFGMEWATIINSDNIDLQPVIKNLEQRVAALESKV